MQRDELEAEALQVFAELARRGVPATSPVHVIVDVEHTVELPISAIAQTGAGFDWLAGEPDISTDADLRLLR